MIQNNDLCLKSLEAVDLPDRHRWLNDAETTRYFTHSGAFPMSLTKLEQWYAKLQTTNDEIHFAVYMKNGKHIGGTQLKALDWKNRSAEFGVFIGEREYRGQGLGQQITRLLMGYGFNTLNLHRIWLRVDEANLAAVRCYQKCGFLEEGRSRDEVYRNGSYHTSIVMSILKPEWSGKVTAGVSAFGN